MKPTFACVLSLLVASAAGSFAQMEMPGPPAGINAALSKLFGSVKAFSAKSDVRVYGKDQKEKVSADMDFALLDERIRVEVHMSRMKNKTMPTSAAASMKQFGMDRVVSVIRPDKKATYIIFPGMQSYVNLALPQEELETYRKEPKIEKTALGKEALDGHPCVKNKVVITDYQGRKQEVTVWTATDLKDFPVQIETQEGDDKVTIRYRQIRLAKPDARQFEPPTGFKEYDDLESLMQGVIIKMMGEGGVPPQ